MMRGVVAWIKTGFLLLIGLLVITQAIEPLYEHVTGSDAVISIGWVSQADLIFEDALLGIGIWIFAVGMFFVAAQYILRRSRTEDRRRV